MPSCAFRYIILYEYKDQRGKEAAFIYFWQGHESSQDEKADSAIMAMQLDDEMGGYPVQVRVVQGKEPPHFFKIFEKMGMCIHEGGIGSGFKNRDDADQYVALLDLCIRTSTYTFPSADKSEPQLVLLLLLCPWIVTLANVCCPYSLSKVRH
jgi:hypothetical protein